MKPGSGCRYVEGKEKRTVPYAKCGCGEEMKPGSGCRYVEMQDKHGKWHKRDTAHEPCHDCNAGVGKVHHWGCDSEDCPVCGGQIMGGDCDGECFNNGTGKIGLKMR